MRLKQLAGKRKRALRLKNQQQFQRCRRPLSSTLARPDHTHRHTRGTCNCPKERCRRDDEQDGDGAHSLPDRASPSVKRALAATPHLQSYTQHEPARERASRLVCRHTASREDVAPLRCPVFAQVNHAQTSVTGFVAS